ARRGDDAERQRRGDGGLRRGDASAGLVLQRDGALDVEAGGGGDRQLEAAADAGEERVHDGEPERHAGLEDELPGDAALRRAGDGDLAERLLRAGEVDALDLEAAGDGERIDR